MAVETVEYIQMLGRMIRAARPRLADANEIEMRAFLQLQAEFDSAIETAVRGYRERQMSWGNIGDALGITRQSAHEFFAHRIGDYS